MVIWAAVYGSGRAHVVPVVAFPIGKWARIRTLRRGFPEQCMAKVRELLMRLIEAGSGAIDFLQLPECDFLAWTPGMCG